MLKPLTQLQLTAIGLLARGHTEMQVAQACERSRGWVQQLKRRPDFEETLKKMVEGVQEGKKEEIKEEVREELQELEEFKTRFRNASNLLYMVSMAHYKKVAQRVATFEPEDIPASRLAQILKLASESVEVALEINKASLGVDELLEIINDFEKAGYKGCKSGNEYEIIATRNEVN